MSIFLELCRLQLQRQYSQISLINLEVLAPEKHETNASLLHINFVELLSKKSSI